MPDQPRMTGRPERIFVSVDASTRRSTISFAPPDAGVPFQRDEDADGSQAMRDAQAILARYPGATIHGPHFHAAPTGRVRQRRRS
jgi:hypothetical protein